MSRTRLAARAAAGRALVALASLGALGALACRRGPGIAPAIARAPAAVARGVVDSFRVAIPGLARERTVRVYRPPAYARGGRYPVLYLQDAQQLFAPGWFGDWRIDETLDSLAAAGRTRGVIVVGVDNGPARWTEYGPWVNASMRAWIDSSWARPVEGGAGDAYVRFLATVLKPEIDRRYRTRRDPAHTAVGGSSMGGLIAVHAGLTRPDVFGRVMAMSPAVWFAEGGGAWLSHNRLVAEARAGAPRGVRFYVDVGTAERSRAADPDVVDAAGRPVSYPRAYREGATALGAALAAGGVPPADLRVVVDSGAEHQERAWARRFPAALEFLFR